MEMQLFIGTKKLLACAMTRGEYNNYRGWDMPKNEKEAETGRLLEYIDGGEANHPDHNGYISWSPDSVFDGSYENVENGMSFEHAFVFLKAGRHISTESWYEETGEYVYLDSKKSSTGGELCLSLRCSSGGLIHNWQIPGVLMLRNDWILMK